MAEGTKSKIRIRTNTIEEQRELFLWKFKDVSRADVMQLEKDFRKYDLNNRGELDEHEAAMLLEHRGMTKTAAEIRAAIADIDFDHNHMIAFVEWCCAFFQKSYADLNDFADEEARAKALEMAMAAGEAAKKAEEAIKAAKEAEEAAAKKRAEELEAESKLTGVAGMKAFFKRAGESTQDTSKSNEQKIKEEAARRKALREAKKAMAEAVELAAKQKSAEDIEKEVVAAAKKVALEEAAAAAKKAADERAERAARKAALNAKWGAGLPPQDKK